MNVAMATIVQPSWVEDVLLLDSSASSPLLTRLADPTPFEHPLCIQRRLYPAHC